MQKAVIVLVIFLSTLFSSKATHIVGGEIYYDYLGNDIYRITLKVYRDCSSNNTNNTQFDDPAPIGIYQNGILIQNLSVPIQSMINVPPLINDPCLQVPANICVEQATYVQDVNLPPSVVGYDIVYQRCCRNPSIINIVNSFDYGATYYIHMPATSLAANNNSPRFSNLPPLVICNGSNFVFDHSATDADGDVLVYEFYTPFHGADPIAPLPNPPLPPPYTTIIWQAGYNVNTQIQGAPAFNINSTTGLMTGSPTTNGLHVYGVTVKEFRNNVLISQSYRDFQTTVTNCPSLVVSAIADQVEFCEGNSISFENNSMNAIYYHWDFGVTTITNDTSNIIEPTYVYADTGTYTITLIANPGYSCADTVFSIYTVHAPLDPFFPPQNAQCITNNSFDFDVDGNFTNSAIINWNFSAAATPNVANTEMVNDVNYSMEGHFLATVNVQEFGCSASYSDSIHVYPLPQIIYFLPPMEGCNPYTAFFTDSTISWEPTYYIWDFGDGNVSFEQSPTHLYDEVGQYVVSLTVRVDSICTFDTTLIFDNLITVNPSPVANITSDITEQSAYTPFFIYYDGATGNTSQTIFFDDGTSVTDSTGIPHAYIYSGWHTATQIAVNEFGCTDTAETLVYVNPETTIFAPNTFTPNGDGLNEVFFVHAYDVAYYHLQIFDRWGNLFFETEDPSKGWDGTNEGKKCPQDTYVYRIFYDDMAVIRKKIIGHVNLVR
jgi:gliding motility-associated-like protein